MSFHVTGASKNAKDQRMRIYPTKVINIIGGPGCDKSLYSSAIILNLNLHQKTVELVPDYAKTLVWQKNFDALRNQYFIAQKQFEMLHLLDGQVQFMVTEGSLPQIMFYNENYPENICDEAKTKRQIMAWYQEFDNVNILVERSDKKYVQTGRLQDEAEARRIDRKLEALLLRENIAFTKLPADIHAINQFIHTLN